MSESKAGKKIFNEFNEKHDFCVGTRQILVQLVVEFILEIFENNSTSDDIRMVCRELVEVFPNLKTEPSKMNGIVTILFIISNQYSKFYIKHLICLILRIFYTIQQIRVDTFTMHCDIAKIKNVPKQN